MRHVFALLTVLFFLLSCSACSPMTPKNPFAYADGAFSVTVQGTYTPATATDESGQPRGFSATVTVGAPTDGNPTLRDLTVIFTSPDTLAGVTVTATPSTAPDGTVRRSVTFSRPSDYGEVRYTATGEELDGLLRFAEALIPLGDVAEVSPEAPDGSFAVTVTVTVTHGTEQVGSETVFWFLRGESLPWRVRKTDEYGHLEMLVMQNAS